LGLSFSLGGTIMMNGGSIRLLVDEDCILTDCINISVG